MAEDSQEKHSSLFAWTVVLLALAVIMSAFAYVRLSNNPRVFQFAIGIVVVLDISLLFLDRKALAKSDVGFDLAYLATILGLVWGAFGEPGTISVRTTPIILLTTIFYRPKLLDHGSRAVAFGFSVTISIVVLPVAFGFVRQSAAVSILSSLYAIQVALLWLFCSRFARPKSQPR